MANPKTGSLRCALEIAEDGSLEYDNEVRISSPFGLENTVAALVMQMRNLKARVEAADFMMMMLRERLEKLERGVSGASAPPGDGNLRTSLWRDKKIDCQVVDGAVPPPGFYTWAVDDD